MLEDSLGNYNNKKKREKYTEQHNKNYSDRITFWIYRQHTLTVV